MAVSTIGNSILPIPVDTLGIGVTPVYGSRSLDSLVENSYVFSTGLSEISNVVRTDDTEINHDVLLNYVSNEHIDWTAATGSISTSGSITTDDLIGYTDADTATIAGVDIVDGLINASFIDGLSANTFLADIDVVLADGKTLGKYVTGETIASTGLTAEEVLNLIATEYLSASWIYFTYSGSTTVEVGTTLSGSKTFTWAIDEGSGQVDEIDIYDVTATASLFTSLTNDGSHSGTINTIQLNTNGSTQSWKGISTDVTPTPDVLLDSSNTTITANYYRYYGAAAARPTDSATVKALPSSAFQTSNVNTFTLNTGLTYNKWYIALPPGRGITSVIDMDAFDLDITSEFTNVSTISVDDAGSTGRSYSLYEMENGVPYSGTEHIFSITTN
jgi:hypothetical protein